MTPVYNTGPYLRPCLDSIMAQTYTDWQLVLVDDGSSDGSGEICDEYAADPRVEVLHVPNGGVSRARNTGLDAARGEWVTFVDSDDIVTPSYLADMLAAVSPAIDSRIGENAVTAECDIVISGWEKDGEVTRLTPRLVPHDDFISFFCDVNYGYILGKLYRRQMLVDKAVRFAEGVRWCEDLLFFWNALLYSRLVNVIDSVNYRYVNHADSSINKLHPYDVEMKGYEACRALSVLINEKISPKICFSPYAFLVRAITSLYAAPMPRHDRLRRLRAIEFDPDEIFTKERGLKPRLFFMLVRGRHWRLLDFFFSSH